MHKFVADHGGIPDIMNPYPDGNVHTTFGGRSASNLRRNFERGAQWPGERWNLTSLVSQSFRGGPLSGVFEVVIPKDTQPLRNFLVSDRRAVARRVISVRLIQHCSFGNAY